VHASVEPGVALCSGRSLVMLEGRFNPMADSACTDCRTRLRLLGDRVRQEG
jgi:hypothetical protein